MPPFIVANDRRGLRGAAGSVECGDLSPLWVLEACRQHEGNQSPILFAARSVTFAVMSPTTRTAERSETASRKAARRGAKPATPLRRKAVTSLRSPRRFAPPSQKLWVIASRGGEGRFCRPGGRSRRGACPDIGSLQFCRVGCVRNCRGRKRFVRGAAKQRKCSSSGCLRFAVKAS